MSEARYLVGIDLGTTNCAVSYSLRPTAADEAKITSFSIPQLVKGGEVEPNELLPSFLYLPTPAEVDASLLALPWNKSPGFAVGTYARDTAGSIPTRLVSSSKSWLCHPGVNRREALLPWLAEDGFPKISPVEASSRLLAHLVSAWNYTIAGKDKLSRLEHQEIILTVPASFDAVARDLTIEAARSAGLENVTLFEEPQAAFYAWLTQMGEAWRQSVKPGDIILVLDVGGGTTDFSLIGVSDRGGNLELERLAVGDHLLIGGDNMDLALAHFVSQQIAKAGSGKLDSAQFLAASHSCRIAKEKLFSNAKAKSQPVTILGRGRKVIGGSLKAELERADVENLITDGFFPITDSDSLPEADSGLGLSEIGLSYPSDPAITKHLAEFLAKHRSATAAFSGKQHGLPSAVLFNGGVFHADTLRERVLKVLSEWSQAGKGELPRELPNYSLDHSVAVGATAYALARAGKSIRIRGGVARSYYVGVEIPRPAIPGTTPPIRAVCIVPKGTEEGTEAELPGKEFALTVGRPASFRFLASTSRPEDTLGKAIEDWEDSIEELASLSATLTAESANETRKTIPVKLLSKVTEIGTLEVWCLERDGSQKWKLEFNLRQANS